MWCFLKHMEKAAGVTLPVRSPQLSRDLPTESLTTPQNFEALYQYSISDCSDFWRHSFEYFPIVYTGTIPDRVFDETARIDSIPKWFYGVKLNFAQNILFSGDAYRSSSTTGKEDDKIACTEVREGSFLEPIQHVSWRKLRQRVGRMQQAMKAHGVIKHDRVAAVSSNSLDTLTVFLATAALGGIFSSSSTDMGSKGILERLIQIRPKFLFMDDGARYNGKIIDLRQKVTEIANGMKHISEFQGVVTQCRWLHHPPDVSSIPHCMTWDRFLSAGHSDKLEFVQLDFSDPLVVVYSSGTTGQPKCIVHGVGGVILNGYKECRLHRALASDSCQLQYTTTGWIMYLGAIQALLTGCRMVMYDGNPFIPDATNLLRLVQQERVSHLSISPRFLRTLKANEIVPKQDFNLSSLKVLTSTGMILPEALSEWVYDVAFPPQIRLDNITGGTDIAGCFGCSNPILPIYSGGCQSGSLGIDVSVFDSAIEGKGAQGRLVRDGTPGELVCTKAFPTMPVAFWGEDGVQKYFDSYFAKYDNCWTHGDFIMRHPTTKQILLYGRADGVLNPSGVRFGSSEIYSVIEEKFADAVTDSICVGQRRPQDDDERVLLFLLMKSGSRFTSSLVRAIKEAIRKQYTPRHVPAFIFETPEIPTTVNLKKVELPVKQIVSGKVVEPSGTLLNPQSLAYFYQFARDENLTEQSASKL